MVIQRWQTLLLLLAIALMCVFTFTPYARVVTIPDQPVDVFAKDTPVILVINAVIAALLVLSIFMFKNLKRQMTITILSALLICVSLTVSLILIYNTEGAGIIWTGGVMLLGVALLAALWAYRLMKKDLKLLRSYDRLR